ncbi:Galactose oxidase [Lachnellula suecica]|uniref:Galactose oxidase n=1 Tax=Lachnellula suecica TaxID=602035 RepID=A0A8T9CF44_9HELO|nr:Galactose oxidase [Lachnellula suecica]
MLNKWRVLLVVIPGFVTAVSITVDSFQVGHEGAKAIDGNSSTFWHSEYSPTLAALPHSAILDLGSSQLLNGFTYLPRQDGSSNGNIGQHTVELSLDGTTWNLVANTTFVDDESQKETGFANAQARYVRITALTEAGNRGSWSSAAEFGVRVASTSTTNGQWGPVIAFPLVPAAAAVSYSTGNIVTFASYRVNTFSIGASVNGCSGSEKLIRDLGNTYTATYNPATNTVSELNVVNTVHDMFCPGMSIDANGRAVVTGGDNANKTSIYDPVTNAWTIGAVMKIPRGYQASTTLSDGRIFTIGGSWSGGYSGKNGEVYNATANTWSLLSGCLVAPMLTNDAQGIFRQDNHGWLFGWKSGSVFQAGPSKAMNWYGTNGTGSQTAAGTRASDTDSMDGNAVIQREDFYRRRSPSYQDSNATSNVHLITIGTPNTTPTVQTLTSMHYQRAFANAVILPNGKIFITGGQSYAVPFTDTTAILTPELWDPTTQTFTVLPAHAIPRTYHSIALLMQDGRVFTGGGGMCGNCATNHEDAQIYSPAYLFNSDGTAATRPGITSVSPATLAVGGTITVVATSALTSFSLIRYGSATHTVDTDQRRIVLTPATTSGTTYTFVLPSDSGVALPGYWMFFGINSAGVPSIAKTIKITVS